MVIGRISLFLSFLLIPAYPAASLPNPAMMSTLNSENYTIAPLREAFHSGELTSTSLVSYYLDRIERYDRTGPKLNSVIETNPAALSQAQAMDAKFAQCRSTAVPSECFKALGDLAGIPILVKDNINTEEMSTTAGSLALLGAVVPGDAEIIKLLRAVGAIILGKAGLTEWSAFRSSQGPNGWSARGGQVRNPYGPYVDVSGS